MIGRQRAGRADAPAAGALDSPTVRAPAADAERRRDGARRTVGRKRHIAVDTDGRLPKVNLTPVHISDSACEVLRAPRAKWPWMKTLLADSACDRKGLTDEAALRACTIEVIRRIEGQGGFRLLPRRPLVARSFARLTRRRRLGRDYEARIDGSEAMTHIAMGSLLLRRSAQ